MCDKPIYLSHPVNSEPLITTASRTFNKKMIIKQNPKIFMEYSVPFRKGLRTMEKGGEKPFVF